MLATANAAMLVLSLATVSTRLPLSFEDPSDVAQLAQGSGLKVFERVAEHATDGDHSLHVVFAGSEADSWPGFSLNFDAPDQTSAGALAFDVFSPAAQPTPLAWRVDDLSGKRVFGGESLAPGATTHIKIWLRSLKYDLDLAHLQRVYIYISKPRGDVELFFDRFRLVTLEGSFLAVTHVPDRVPTGLPSPTGPAMIAFERPWMQHVFADDWPAEDEPAPKPSIAAARGEYEPLTICIAARRDLHGLTAMISDFTGPGNVDRVSGQAKIAASAVDVRVVRALDKRWTYPDTRYIAGMPVLLEAQPKEGVDLAAGRVGRFWLTVHVPPDAKPGDYKAIVTVAEKPLSPTASGAPVQIPVSLHIYPFALPEVKDKLWGVYYTGPTAFEEGEDLVKLEAHLRDMRAHGMTSVGLCFGWDPAQNNVEAKRVDFLPAGQGRYETFMQLYHDLGFPAPLLQLADTPQDIAAGPINQPRFAEAYAGIWKYVEDYAAKQKGPKIIVQPVDEPAWGGADAGERNRVLLDILRRLAPGIVTEQDGPDDDYFRHVAGPLCDVWNFNGSLPPPEVVASAHKDGKTVLIYNCDVEFYRPVVDRYVAGWFQEAAGIDGCFNWAYQSVAGDPYDDQDGPLGDEVAYYPPGHGHVGGPSIGWEGMREGIDDYRYIALLRDLIVAARKKGGRSAELASRAESDLKEILASIKYNSSVRETPAWDKVTTKDGKVTIGGSLNLPNGWSLEDYDHARRHVADWCVRLLAGR
jgi:hypothetical protein